MVLVQNVVFVHPHVDGDPLLVNYILFEMDPSYEGVDAVINTLIYV